MSVNTLIIRFYSMYEFISVLIAKRVELEAPLYQAGGPVETGEGTSWYYNPPLPPRRSWTWRLSEEGPKALVLEMWLKTSALVSPIERLRWYW